MVKYMNNNNIFCVFYSLEVSIDITKLQYSNA